MNQEAFYPLMYDIRAQFPRKWDLLLWFFFFFCMIIPQFLFIQIIVVNHYSLWWRCATNQIFVALIRNLTEFIWLLAKKKRIRSQHVKGSLWKKGEERIALTLWVLYKRVSPICSPFNLYWLIKPFLSLSVYLNKMSSSIILSLYFHRKKRTSVYETQKTPSVTSHLFFLSINDNSAPVFI